MKDLAEPWLLYLCTDPSPYSSYSSAKDSPVEQLKGVAPIQMFFTVPPLQNEISLTMQMTRFSPRVSPQPVAAFRMRFSVDKLKISDGE